MLLLFQFLALFMTLAYAFYPREYAKSTATCNALNRASGEVVKIQISYVNVDLQPRHKKKKTLLMVHGWPSLWSSWARQIDEFKDDYQLIIPDLRGFGESSHPGDVRTSGTMGDMVGDLVCVLDHAGVVTENVVCVGHDWGSQICFEAGRARPDLFSAVVGVTVPYVPAHSDFRPISSLTPVFPKLTYQLYFDRRTKQAVTELDGDIRRSLRATLRTKGKPPPEGYLVSETSFLDAYAESDGEIERVEFFREEEEEYFVSEFRRQGFANTLGFYTTENRLASWEFAHGQGNHTIRVPVLSILPTHDTVADWVSAQKLLQSEDFIEDYTMELVEGSHWVHIENYEVVNGVVRGWLAAKFGNGSITSREEL